ncbi:MAG: hypothetical protein WC292_01005 [Clostridia bacterium]
MQKAFKFISLLVIVALFSGLIAILFTGCAKQESKGIIIIPGIIGSAYIDTDAKDEDGNIVEQSVWDPFNGKLGWYDLFGEEGQTFRMDNPKVIEEMRETMLPVFFALAKEENIVTQMMIDEDGKPSDKSVKVADMNTQSDLKYGTLGAYKEMYSELSNCYGEEYEVSVFQFDWRLDGQDAGKLLEDYIQAKDYSKVILIGHSMGGMVASNYLSRSQANRDKTELFISIVAPLLGSIMAPQIVINSSGLMGGLLPSSLSFMIDTFDEMLYPLVKNSYVGYQLFPNEDYFSNPYYPEGESCIYIDDQPASLTQLTDYVKAQDWAKHSSGELKPAVANMSALYDSLYIDNNGQRTHVTDLVNTYYFVATGSNTASVFRLYSDGNTAIETFTEGDGIVSAYSAACGKPLDHERVLLYKDISHTTVGIYFNLYIKDDVFGLIDAL